jgi:hypothetical protein
MKQDRFLWVILGVIGALIIAAIVLFFIRGEPQGYGLEDTPEGVLRNYVLSLQEGDFQRAYGYLQATENQPSFTTFQQSMLRNDEGLSQAAIQLGSVKITGDNALVNVTIIHNNNDPFDRTWIENTTGLLTLQGGEWRLVNMPYPYWGWDWYLEK